MTQYSIVTQTTDHLKNKPEVYSKFHLRDNLDAMLVS